MLLYFAPPWKINYINMRHNSYLLKLRLIEMLTCNNNFVNKQNKKVTGRMLT